MSFRTIVRIVAALVVAVTFRASAVAEAASPLAESWSQLLVDGKLADAEKMLGDKIAATAGDDEARFALGVTQTLSALEGLMQSLYKYGLDPAWANNLPFVRLPVPKNPKPDALTNAAFRKIVADFEADLAKVETTLAPVKSADLKLPLMLGEYTLDFDGDGRATDDEALYMVLNRTTGANIAPKDAQDFVIMADLGDVHWLRGYCHLLRALCEMHLAHDTQDMHDHAATLFFPTADAKYAVVEREDEEMFDDILDAIAFIHLIRLPVAEPQRMETARQHILAALGQSRESWDAILAETDDDLEWIPNPNQKMAVIPNARVSKEMIAGWRATLDETQRILEGKKLVPFWRGHGTRGLNLKRFFTEPQTFDLVLWIQGSAALPYLEKGEVTDTQLWNDILTGFRGQFFTFAVWVN